MMATEATRAAVRDPENARKTDAEDMKTMSFRAPMSIRDYLQKAPDGITGTIIESVELKRDLDALLEAVRPELVRAAAEIGKEYSLSQAATLAHVIKRCLSKPKK